MEEQTKDPETDNIRIKDIPLSERPRERLTQLGAEALSAPELLAIILRTGTEKENVIELANRVLKEHGLKTLSQASVEELKKIFGIGEAKACQIVACFELNKRLSSYQDSKQYIKTSEDVAKLFMERFKDLKKEYFSIINLTSKNKMINHQTISIGDLNESLAHPREIFHSAIKSSASRVILIHNHPSGDPSPSEADLQLTERLMEAGELLGITVLDHVIIGNGKWWSWREKK
ncbi:MAG: DNA repair protein RadC [Candidatus Aenigmatarchaeota archaeon]